MTPPRAAPTPWARLARLSLAQWMLLAAAGGVACGLLAPGVASSLGIVTDIFLRLSRAIVAPVLVGVLIRAVGSQQPLLQYRHYLGRKVPAALPPALV